MVAEHNITFESPEAKKKRLAAEQDAKHDELRRLIALARAEAA